MKKSGRVILVTHPEHGTYRAEGVRDKLQAVQAAAGKWDMQWSKIARECSFAETGETAPQSAEPTAPLTRGASDPSLRSE